MSLNPSLSDLLQLWLKAPVDGRYFCYDDYTEVIRCEKCRCHTAIVDDDGANLYFRPETPVRDGGAYEPVSAANPEFFKILERYHLEHKCR